MKKTLLQLLFLAFASTNFSLAQSTQKLDKIIKKNYDIIEASITKISEKQVEFTYPEETFTNTLELSEVVKIIYKSGRIQEFKVEPKVEMVTQIEEKSKTTELPIKQNTIAVLPIPFVNTETLASSAEMAKFAQNDMYSQLIEKSSNIFPLTVQDLRNTNSLLKKAGIDYTNIDETPIEDLQKILGVDHIVAAKVSYIIERRQDNVGYNKTDIKTNDNKAKIDDFSVSTSKEEKRFEFTVYFDMYKNNSKIYTKTRQPIFKEKDSWMDSMQYLLKRSPIYTK